MMKVESVASTLAQALEKKGYETLTPVQEAVIEPHLQDADLLVSAQTGSGKTVAFGMAMAANLLGEEERFEHANAPLALIIAPTRELALQVKRELQWLYGETGASIASCVGGMDMRTERRTLERGAHIVVGTPGRLRDHIMRRSFDTSALKAVVLDEADEMLDLGFREDLEFILEAAPSERRTLLFSATVPTMIAQLARRFQRDAVRIMTAGEQKQHVDIEYRVLGTAVREKENAIMNVLRFYDAENAIVFCNTRAMVNHMVSRLNNRGFSVVGLSGELTQNERTHALQAMRDGRAKVCVATDVAARGIDLPKLELVVHADLPNNPETLLHRSGRTGRAGRKGVSALMVDAKGGKKAERLLHFAQIKATWDHPPSAEDINRRDETRLLSDPFLTEALLDDEKDFVEKLLESHGVEQIAAAYLRLYRTGRSAPEELEEISIESLTRGGGKSDGKGRKRSAKPHRGQSGKPRRGDDKPYRDDADRPRRGDFDKPRRGGSSDKPRRGDDKPYRGDGDKPRRSDSDKPYKSDGDFKGGFKKKNDEGKSDKFKKRKKPQSGFSYEGKPGGKKKTGPSSSKSSGKPPFKGGKKPKFKKDKG